MDKKDLRLILEAERTSKEYAKHYFETESEMQGMFELDTKILDSIIKQGKVLDAMMGPGRHVVQLAGKNLEVHGNDFNRHAVKIAAQSLKKKGLKAELTISDVRKLPMKSNTFDYVISMYNAIGSIMGRAERQRAVSEMARVCKKGGIVIIHVHNLLGDLTHLPDLHDCIRNLLFRQRSLDQGDFIVFDPYLKKTFQHFFTPNEVQRMLEKTGLRAMRHHFLRGHAQSTIAKGPFKQILSSGFIVVAEKL